jgi:3-methyladenine DNA glycosylase AlkC
MGAEAQTLGMTSEDNPAPALKEIFNRARLQHIARELAAVAPQLDTKRFLAASLRGLEALSIMERVRHIAECLHPILPADFRAAVEVLRQLAPRLNSAFVTMILPEYVALFGQHDFAFAMDALKFLTRFGSSEFAVRHFLRLDLPRGLKIMEHWSRDENEHVRRLASEGSRPRLPWSFRLEPLRLDPAPLFPILGNLKADPSRYVRRSVANSLNDITKDHPERALALLESWPLDVPHTAWIARHALRSLIKKGNPRALRIIGADDTAEATALNLTVTPRKVRIGGEVAIAFTLRSTASRSQRLVVDYAVHYVKKSGQTAAKVFKWKTLTLAPEESVAFQKRHWLKNFTTRVHYPGTHTVELLANGHSLARATFELLA